MYLLVPNHHCGWYISSARTKVTSKPATEWNISYLLDCWLGISSVDGLHCWLLVAPIYWSPIGLDTVENSWGLFQIYRDLLRKLQFLVWYVSLVTYLGSRIGDCIYQTKIKSRYQSWISSKNLAQNQNNWSANSQLDSLRTKNRMYYYFNKLFKKLWV